jgi:hypothetical protein
MMKISKDHGRITTNTQTTYQHYTTVKLTKYGYIKSRRWVTEKEKDFVVDGRQKEGG